MLLPAQGVDIAPILPGPVHEWTQGRVCLDADGTKTHGPSISWISPGAVLLLKRHPDLDSHIAGEIANARPMSSQTVSETVQRSECVQNDWTKIDQSEVFF